MLRFQNLIHVDQTVHVDARPYIRMNDSNHVVGYNIGNLTNFSSVNFTPSSGPEPLPPKWGVLAIVLIVFCTAIGNLLVCLAVIWDRRLQNMTNYFLMSLAIADFLVSILVMPFGMLVELFGNFPLRPEFCIFWVTTDVLMCTASIWHMCTMSMDRYFTLKYPMKYGRNKTKMTVALKILFVWLVSITISSPICVYGISDTNSVFNEGQCVPAIQDFVIYGSIFAFYIPLTIMLITYVLTIRILWRNQKLMKIDRSDMKSMRKHGDRCEMKSLLHPQPEEGDKSNDTDATVLGTQLNTPRHDDKSPQNQLSLPNGNPAVKSLPETSFIQKFHSKYSIKCADDPKEDKESEMVQIKISKSIPRTGHVQDAGEMKLEQKASSLSCLKASHYDYPSYSSMCTKSPKSHLLLPARGDNFLRLSSHDSLVKRSVEKPCMHQAVSCSTVNTSTSILSNLIPCSGNSHFHSCSDIGKKDLKLVEWKENYSKIQKEMDQILKGDFDKEDPKSSRQPLLAQAKSLSSEDSIWNKEISEDETNYDSTHENSSNKNVGTETDVKHLRQISDNSDKNPWDENDSTSDVLYWSTSQVLPRTETSQQFTTSINNNTFFPKRDTETSLLNSKHTGENENPSQYLCESRRQSQSSNNISISSQHSMPLSDSGDSIIDPSDISGNSECLTIKLRPTTLQMYKFTTKSPSPSSPLMGPGSRLYGGSEHQLCNGTGNGQAGHKVINRSLKKQTINKLLSKFNKTQGASPVMSKRATTNERKASKVLGIIFAVFVILWTPFFTVNILSVTCQHCMQNVTPELMSVFLWMGYMASLANPIIYTMFNTAFRRAFIRILKCHICINGSLRAADRSTMSYPMSFTERRKHGGQISVNYHHHPL